MSDYLHQDHEGPKLDHPDAMIRVASVVHRFRVPRMVATARKISFAYRASDGMAVKQLDRAFPCYVLRPAGESQS